MTEPEKHQGSRRNAETTRQAILDAAEAVFAEHGFDGARVESIAKASGYNQGLIFRYFGDKLGLYAEVLRRIDAQGMEFQSQLISPLMEDETTVTDPRRLRSYLTDGVRAMYDYMTEHPQVIRMMLWEHAEGWQTYTRLASVFEVEDLKHIEALFYQAGKAQNGTDLFILLILAEQVCWTFLSSFPFYQMILPGQDISTGAARERLREQVVRFIVSGILGNLDISEMD